VCHLQVKYRVKSATRHVGDKLFDLVTNTFTFSASDVSVSIWLLSKYCFIFVAYYLSSSFYRVMHYSAKRSHEIACRLSVCDVGGS